MGNTLIFIGTIKKVANCGESMKNHLFIRRFRELFDKVITVDVWQPKKHPWNILKLIIVTLTHRKSIVAMSVSISTGDKILHLLQTLGCKNIYYWAVGGTLHEKLSTGKYELEPYKAINAIYVQSPRIVNGLRSLGINNAIHVNNSKRIDYIPNIERRNNSIVKFVFLSRVHPDKGCNMIIDCVQRLNGEGYNNKFLVDFYGKIDDRYIEFLPKVEHVENVAYKGFLDLTSKRGYETLATYDMMLFPTYWDGEGFPGVVIDAYIAGLPIIASNWNCNEDVINNETGIIIPHHNVEALYESMKAVLDGKYDLRGMARFCQIQAKEYDNRNILSAEHLRQIGFIK